VIRRFLFVIGVALILCYPILAYSQVIDHDEEGPGAFYFQQYEEEPWRSPSTPRILFQESEKLALIATLVAGYLYFQKKKA